VSLCVFVRRFFSRAVALYLRRTRQRLGRATAAVLALGRTDQSYQLQVPEGHNS
jgi:hypothetical protein